MKIYVYGSLADSFRLSSIPMRGFVDFAVGGDLKGYSAYVYYLEPLTTERTKRFNLAFLGTFVA